MERDVVRAIRGVDVKASEAELDAIREFFESRRIRGALNPKSRSMTSRRFGFPGDVRDWFVPRLAPARPQYKIDCLPDEQMMYGHAKRLHDLGIPTFLCELPGPSPMKVLFSFEVYISEHFPEGGDLGATRECFIDFVVICMAKMAKKLFGEAGRKNLVAIYDASGHSDTEDRMKIAFRSVFIDLAVNLETAIRAREVLICLLEDAWREVQLEPWVSSLDLRSRDEAASGSFWEHVVKPAPFAEGETVGPCMVYCEGIQSEFDLPDKRPLRPHCLMDVRVGDGDGLFTIRRCQHAQTLSDEQWMALGSTWTADRVPTRFWGVGDSSRIPAEAVLPGGTSWAQQQERQRQQASQAHHAHLWKEYTDNHGRVYYHCSHTKDSVWILPEGANLDT